MSVRAFRSDDESDETMNQVHEKLGVLQAKADAAHSRVDKLEAGIKSDLVEIQKDLKELAAYMHRTKGWTAALVFLAGASGGGIAKLITLLFDKG